MGLPLTLMPRLLLSKGWMVARTSKAWTYGWRSIHCGGNPGGTSSPFQGASRLPARNMRTPFGERIVKTGVGESDRMVGPERPLTLDQRVTGTQVSAGCFGGAGRSAREFVVMGAAVETWATGA